MEYLVYVLVVVGALGIGGKTYFEQQLAAKAKEKRDAATSSKRRSQLAVVGQQTASGRKRKAQFGRRNTA